MRNSIKSSVEMEGKKKADTVSIEGMKEKGLFSMHRRQRRNRRGGRGETKKEGEKAPLPQSLMAQHLC